VNILHIGKYYAPYEGGIENFLKDLAVAQAERGHAVTVLCHHHTFAIKPVREMRDQVMVIRAPFLREAAHAPLSPGFTLILSRELKRNPPDLIHVHMPNLSALCLGFMSPLPPMVIHWHADVVSAPGVSLLRLFYPFYKIFEKRLLQKAQRIIATSRAHLQSSRPLAPHKNKCTVVPLGIDARRMQTEWSRYRKEGAELVPTDAHDPETGTKEKRHVLVESFRRRVDQADFLAVAVGRFTIYKGFDILVQAARKIPQITMVIVGEGLLWNDIKALCRRLQVEDSVLLPGKLSSEDLHALMARCSVFVLPSIERTEAFGLVLLEAMYYAKPLITTGVPGSGMSEVNVHESTGLVVPPGDADALAAGIQRLARDPAERKAMGARARTRLQDFFSITMVANGIDMVYADILQYP